MLTLSKIIEEADVRVPNAFDNPQKVDWLNEINVQFFDVVKMPRTHLFNGVSTVGQYTLSSGVRSKNIDKVMIGNMVYQSMQFENVLPGRSFWTFDDSTYQLSVSPAPIESAAGIVRYFQRATTTFVSGTLTAVPDAPDEYHWVYILGLCERIAKAQEDLSKANNYANEYLANLNIAQQNFANR